MCLLFGKGLQVQALLRYTRLQVPSSERTIQLLTSQLVMLIFHTWHNSMVWDLCLYEIGQTTNIKQLKKMTTGCMENYPYMRVCSKCTVVISTTWSAKHTKQLGLKNLLHWNFQNVVTKSQYLKHTEIHINKMHFKTATKQHFYIHNIKNVWISQKSLNSVAAEQIHILRKRDYKHLVLLRTVNMHPFCKYVCNTLVSQSVSGEINISCSIHSFPDSKILR